MSFQGFSAQLRLAKAIGNTRTKVQPAVTEEQRVRQKELTKARNEKRLAENLAQRALIESRRA